MDYAFWFMMMVVACIVYSVLQYTLKAAVRRFTRRGSVENEDHSYIIEGILVKTMFQFLACEVESLNVSEKHSVGLNITIDSMLNKQVRYE